MYNYEHGIFHYDLNGIDTEAFPVASKHPRVTCTTSNVIRNIVVILTLLSVGCLIFRELLRVKWESEYFNPF